MSTTDFWNFKNTEPKIFYDSTQEMIKFPINIMLAKPSFASDHKKMLAQCDANQNTFGWCNSTCSIFLTRILLSFFLQIVSSFNIKQFQDCKQMDNLIHRDILLPLRKKLPFTFSESYIELKITLILSMTFNAHNLLFSISQEINTFIIKNKHF